MQKRDWEFVIKDEFFDCLDQINGSKPPLNDQLDWLDYLSSNFIAKLRSKYFKTLDKKVLIQAVKQIEYEIERMIMYASYVSTERARIWAIINHSKENIEGYQATKTDLDELESFEIYFELWSQLEGLLIQYKTNISSIEFEDRENLPLNVYAGICFYADILVTKTNYSEILDDFNYAGKRTNKIYINYTQHWLRNANKTLINKTLYNYYPQIIKYLEKHYPDKAQKARDDYKYKIPEQSHQRL
jgi:hypothetical protein